MGVAKSQAMETDRKWIIIRIEGKIAAVSDDYRMLASISAQLAKTPASKGKKDKAASCLYDEICVKTVDFNEVWKLRHEVRWEDLMLFGTEFQKKVWKKLWELTHPEDAQEDGSLEGNSRKAQLICYSDFADLCQNRAGVRAVAHAVSLNPVAAIIPCHLVIPKEAIDKINSIQTKAEDTIFKGEDLCLDSILKDESIDFGEYSLGRDLKRILITLELTGNVS